MSKTSRIYKIDMLIRRHGSVSFARLLEALEVSPATLKRDLEYLRDRLGAPIVYDRETNGYRLADEPAVLPQRAGERRHELPGMWFDEGELYALLMAQQLLGSVDEDGVLGRHLAPMVARIHELLGPEGEGDARTLMQRVRILTTQRRPVPHEAFERVGQALVRRRRLLLDYLTRGSGQRRPRRLSPQRLVHHRNTWYLDAWCHDRERLQRFALDAMDNVRIDEERARDVATTAVAEAMDGGYGVFAGGRLRTARLRFAPRAAQWVQHERWHEAQHGELDSLGRWTLTLPYHDDTELAMDLLRWSDEVEVLAPASLRERLVERLEAALALHTGTQGRRDKGTATAQVE